MIVQAQLDRKPGGYPPPRCQVEKVVELPAGEFDDFLKNPLQDQAFITENKEVMYDDGHMAHCLLVLGRDRNDGVLVEAEGYDFAKYAAFLFGARDIVNAEIRQAADRIVREGVENTSEGSWCFYFDELYEQTGLVVKEGNGLGEMLLEALRQRPEIADVEMTGECFDAVYYLDFCKNLSSSAQPEEHPSRSPDLLVNKLLDYLAEHDGSEELYQMLHGDLGFTNAEIDALGFGLEHRFEDEPGMTQPQL